MWRQPAAARGYGHLRVLTQFASRLRWGSLESRRARGLVRLHDVLARTGFHARYWIFLGLLLGCMRGGAPIRWDQDSDFAFLDRDLPQFLTALTALRQDGFDLRPLQVNNDGRTTKWALRHEGVKYEFFQLDVRGARLRWHYHRRQPSIEIVNEIPAHGLASLELYGRRFMIPDNPELQLTQIYGDWRTPHPGYTYWRDCRATVSRHAWAGKRRAPPPA